MFMLTLIGISMIGLFASRNERVKQQVQKGYKTVQNAIQKAVPPMQNRVAAATAEFAEEIKPNVNQNKRC